MLIAAGHSEEGTVVGLLAQAVRQNFLLNRWQPFAALDPVVHAASGQWCSMLSFAYGDRRLYPFTEPHPGMVPSSSTQARMSQRREQTQPP